MSPSLQKVPLDSPALQKPSWAPESRAGGGWRGGETAGVEQSEGLGREKWPEEPKEETEKESEDTSLRQETQVRIRSTSYAHSLYQNRMVA